jgi:hypothetical protein
MEINRRPVRRFRYVTNGVAWTVDSVTINIPAQEQNMARALTDFKPHLLLGIHGCQREMYPSGSLHVFRANQTI